MQIHAAVVMRAAQRATRRSAVGRVVGAERHFASVGVDRVRKQVVNGNASLEVHRSAQGQALHAAVSKRVAHEAVRKVTNVSIQDARSELLPEQIEGSLGEVEQ